MSDRFIIVSVIFKMGQPVPVMILVWTKKKKKLCLCRLMAQ